MPASRLRHAELNAAREKSAVAYGKLGTPPTSSAEHKVRCFATRPVTWAVIEDAVRPHTRFGAWWRGSSGGEVSSQPNRIWVPRTNLSSTGSVLRIVIEFCVTIQVVCGSPAALAVRTQACAAAGATAMQIATAMPPMLSRRATRTHRIVVRWTGPV